MPLYSGTRNQSYTGDAVFTVSVDLAAATATTAGAVAAIANPIGTDLIVVAAYINITTAASTATNTITAGPAANATTSNSGLFNGQAASAGLKVGTKDVLWGASQVVTATASATLAGMVATLTLVCVRA